MRLPRNNPAVDRQYDVVMQALFQATRERDLFKLTSLLQKSLSSIDTNIGIFDMADLGGKVMGSKVRLDQRLPAVSDLVQADGSHPPVYTADLDVALERAAAFCRVVATGTAFDADHLDIVDSTGADRVTRSASALLKTADELAHGAELWRSGDLE
jgi:hypothetical protein